MENTTGDRVRYLRKDILGLNQAEFGSRIGLKSGAISYIESNINNLTEQTAKAICNEFNINEEWLKTGKGEMSKAPEDETALIVAKLLDKSDIPFYNLILNIVKTYEQLDSKSQKVLEDFAKKLLENSKK